MPYRNSPTLDLFGGPVERGSAIHELLADGAIVLKGFAVSKADTLLGGLEAILAAAPFRHMVTPGGFRMSVAMTNCGHVGWVTDRSGYRYEARDPTTGRAWPAMPGCFLQLAEAAARAAGFGDFVPDSCLINRYEPGARMSLHQDRNERDFSAPIVSLSLGLSATFLFGGLERGQRPKRVVLDSGDVVVWGGPARLAFHGVAPLAEGEHPLTGRQRINLTFRKAL
jgi:alkylated DNA repair protein (DNA oxidative demethylase)